MLTWRVFAETVNVAQCYQFSVMDSFLWMSNKYTVRHCSSHNFSDRLLLLYVNMHPNYICGYNFVYTAIGPPAYPVVAEVMPSPNLVMISWIIPIIAFDYENYSVVYSNEMGMLVGTEEMMGSTDLNAFNETFSVIIDGLTPFTTYSFVVIATNSNGTAATDPMTFTTDEAGMLLYSFMYIDVLVDKHVMICICSSCNCSQ